MKPKLARVLLPKAKLFPLSYYIPNHLTLQIGSLVTVPFKNKDSIGIIWELTNESENIKNIKYIEDTAFNSIILNKEILDLISKAASYYMCELGSIAKLVLPVDLCNLNYSSPKIELNSSNLANLSTAQQITLEKIKKIPKPVVIKGITGSGKTEIYFNLIAELIGENKQCLIMLPEISLSAQIIKRFKDRFAFEPAIWNSSITKTKKQKILASIIEGRALITIGARSSLFLPYKNLSLIVVDEEHDASYKQEDNILYNARDMAVLRGSLSGPKVLLCSATPSIETLYNVSLGKYHLVELHERYNNASLPDVGIIDMRASGLPKNKWLSYELIKKIKQTLDKGEQILLFLNRRGYSPLLICRSCGYRVNCPNCTTWLVMHKAAKKLECHHCGYKAAIPKICKDCKSADTLYPCGPGIERIFEEATELFPTAKIALISKDQTKKIKDLELLLHEMEKGKIDILIGTQVITKGYHFPKLTLVAAIDADLGFSEVDLKSSEKNFQLLYQVGGRAGREHKPGSLLLQTYRPDNIIFKSLSEHKIDDFINYELKTRKLMNMPPFSKTASLILTGKHEEKLFLFSKTLAGLAPTSKEVRILGPARALISKIAGKYRYRIIVITSKTFPLQLYLTTWLKNIKIPSSIHTKIDIDPISFN